MKGSEHLKISQIYSINDRVPAFDLWSIIHAPDSWILTNFVFLLRETDIV